MFAFVQAMAKNMMVLPMAIGVSCSHAIVDPLPPPEDVTSTPKLAITEVAVGAPSPGDPFRMITFDLNWENNWRAGDSPDNWDAVWIFAKVRIGTSDWKHATLSAVPGDHQTPSGSTITPAPDGKGVFFRHGADSAGTFRATGISLRWNHTQDGVADDASVDVRVFGLVMVYIPEGSFNAGDNTGSWASLTQGSGDRRPWFIGSENPIEVENKASGGHYYQSSKDFWNETWNASEDVSGTEFVIPADFPKGFRAVVCMKYELTEQQYADFLNALNPAQARNRYDGANFNRFGYTISDNNDVYSTANPNRACGFISPADGFAYADWSGLRPMSELEFEKICRGSGRPPVSGEYAWGTIYCRNAASADGTENDRDYVTGSGANTYFMESNWQPRFPLIAGVFGDQGKTREQSGASYYGVMEMSGNLCETCISIGNSIGRAFTFHNGNGELSADGSADENGWPGYDGVGAGFRGGCLAEEQGYLWVSERAEATVAIAATHRHIPWGFRGVRTVSF